ncbi:MAG: histidine kinase [Desulfofustis sp.]|nr:histidine kinase [Desulfofustis sp.]
MRAPLRVKLLLVSLLLLIIPLLGMRFNSSLKASLLASQEDTLNLTATAVATALNNRAELFVSEGFHSLQQDSDLYLFQLSNTIKIADHEITDWLPEYAKAKEYGREHLLEGNPDFDPDSLSFRYIAGKQDGFLYVLFDVVDNRLVYQGDNLLDFDGSDHLQVVIGKHGFQQTYILAPRGPGLVIGVLKPLNAFVDPPAESRIIGMWNETDQGYMLEVRIDAEMLGDKLAFAVADVDAAESGKIEAVIGTADEELGLLLSTSSATEEILESLDRPYARIRVVDRNRRVRAEVGGLQDARESLPASDNFLDRLLIGVHGLFQPVFRFFTNSFSTDIEDSASQPTEIDLQGLEEGFEGRSSIVRYRIETGLAEVMAAITPVYDGDEVVAVVVVEQTTNSILSLSNKLIEETVSVSIIAFLIGGGALFVFALIISTRIRTLRDQADASLTENGQIQNAITKTGAQDEIGDLGRTLERMLNQLQEQIDHREKMADNLEHEMRTPLAGVAASLKNIEEELGDEHPRILEYLDGAKHNSQRLHELLTAIREGATLKASLSHEQMEVIDFGEALSKWLDFVWREAFPGVEFSNKKPNRPVKIRGDVDRLLQALDKLIENAVSYHAPGTVIELSLDHFGNWTTLQIVNQGATLDPAIRHRIFGYMVSSRVSKDTNPHLGLGLYVAKTIIDYHGGALSADNLQDGRAGVVFSVRFPREF